MSTAVQFHKIASKRCIDEYNATNPVQYEIVEISVSVFLMIPLNLYIDLMCQTNSATLQVGIIEYAAHSIINEPFVM